MWFKVDDKLHDHRKARGVDTAAMGLWVLAGSWCGDNGTDGFVPESIPVRWSRSFRRLAGQLVGAGLWETCEQAGEAGWRFVNWPEWQPKRTEVQEPLERVRWRRKQALKKNRPLCEAVVTRDKGCCRYCGTRVNWADRKGTTGGTYDHIDPDGDNTIDNVVVACRRCNGRKRDRTPTEAGMTLLDPPGSDPAPEEPGQ